MSRRNFLIAGLGIAGMAAFGGLYVYRRSVRNAGSGRGTVGYSEYEGPSTRLADLPDDTEYDVCVVGSGPAGAFLASDLADRGFRVLILESGQSPSVAASDPRYGTLNGYRVGGSIDYPLSSTHLMAPGGTSALWNGRCFRLSPSDFARNAYTPAGSEWPVSYADLAPFYDRAEQSLRVAGDPQQDMGVERSSVLPKLDPILPPEAPIRMYAAKAGMMPGSVTQPTTSRSEGFDGPIRVARDILPGVARKPGVTLVLGATAHRFAEDESGRVTSVAVRAIDGFTKHVRARQFVLAAGGVETARRLLLSRSERWPEGLGNHHGRVGRSFSEHTSVKYQTVVDIPDIDRDKDGLYEQARTFSLYEPFKQKGLGGVMVHLQVYPESNDRKSPKHVLRIQGEIELEFTDQNRLSLAADPYAVDPFGDPYPDLTFGFSDRDRTMIESTRQAIIDIYRRIGITEDKLTENTVRGWGHHHLGTVRMGADPATSVVDANLRVHGLQNLYATTSGVFVTGGAVNPTLTIVALTHRLADHLQAQLRQSA